MPAHITKNITSPTRTIPGPVMVDNIKAFRLILDNAVPGQRIIYYTGDLMYDRDHETTRLGATHKRELNKLADGVYDACMLERVHLLQKRLGKNKWEYTAIVRR
jgi:hypothetical protein